MTHADKPCAGSLCPSAQPEMADAVVIGVRTGPAGDPRIAYLDRSLPVTGELLALAAPVPATEVYRFAARCEERACAHFDGTDCRLAQRIVRILPAVVDVLPPCGIRGWCRWFAQEGGPACRRCPQVVTQTYDAAEEFKRAAAPD